MNEALYIMVGGFLGAGKTTALGKLGRSLTERGYRVGLITNDQGSHLADTMRLRSQGFSVEEISGGCFCCRFNSLIEAAGKLSSKEAPDVFLAEPVGSCTDLVATVTYPLRRIYGDRFTIAPFSVLLDPRRFLRILGKREGSSFSPKVRYIYHKQMEEADLLVVNKIDLLGAAEREEVRGCLESLHPEKRFHELSARTGEGMEKWLDTLLDEGPRAPAALDIDYDDYAEGEALLGWVNATLRVQGEIEFDGNLLLENLASGLQRRLSEKGARIAHLKMTFSPDDGIGDIGTLSVVGNDSSPEPGHRLRDPVLSGDLILNLRAEGDPETLWKSVQWEVLSPFQQKTCRFEVKHHEAFQPGRPKPTHRYTTVKV